MAKRVCDKCGKNKDLDGGKTCEKGHFFCLGCQRAFGGVGSKCLLCKTPLK